jgi:hypothetical protein
MEIVAIWKVPAIKTRDFDKTMKEKSLRKDSPATLLNVCAGFNFFYETEESYGDITEETANSMAMQNSVPFKYFRLS